VLKYLPVNVAEDNGDGDVEIIGSWTHPQTWVQGRASVLLNGSYSERNCQLFSSIGQMSAAPKYQSMTSNGVAKDCHYGNGTRYATGTPLHRVFAYNKKQCCNACVATTGCVAAHFLTSAKDRSGMGPNHDWEGFAVHMASVTGNTTGGIPVKQVEGHFQDRLANLSSYDQFMDYGVTFFTQDLQPYHDAFKRDGVAVYTAEWVDETTQDLWYSLFFLIPGSMYVIELTSSHLGATTPLPRIEQRMSPAAVTKFRSYTADPAHTLWVTSINRAASNMSAIDQVYGGILMANVTHEIKSKDLVRRCYKMSEEAVPTMHNTFQWNDVCFTSRTLDAEKDKIFSVLDFERTLWAAHAGTLGSNPYSQADKYTDNHNGLLFNTDGLTALRNHFVAHNPYPITKDTRLAYACKQSYIIDPTGWSSSPVPTQMTGWPGCY